MVDPAPAPAKKPQGKTLVGILGASAAIGSIVGIAREESGRTVTATVAADGHVHTANVRGRIYLTAYRDSVKVATACDGLTRNLDGTPIKLGQRFTEAQCDAILEKELVDEADHVMACTPGLGGEGHDNQRIAAMLLVHNIGSPRYCRSAQSPRIQFNAHRYRAGCQQFIAWRFAGGRPILEGRRKREIAICMKDVR
jgi:lysozyme